MIPVTDLRAGTIFSEDKEIYEVLSYEHQKLGRGSATIKVKVRSLRSGATLEKSFTSGGRVTDVQLEKKSAQFLYKNDDSYVFMDTQTFEQHTVNVRKLGDKHLHLLEGREVKLWFLENEPLSIDLPIKMEFTVSDAPPNVKGNSATNIWKEATLETGQKIKVPLFISSGDRVRVDTRTGEYVERVGK